MTAADEVLALFDTRSPVRDTRGALVCIDGPAGAGKTTLANEVAAARDLTVLHLDDVYPGWDGLDRFEPVVLQVLDDLHADRAASYRRYDWEAGTHAERVEIPADRGMVIEGVGAGNTRIAAHTTVLVWVEAPIEVCDARWLARDGELMTRHGPGWRRAEAALFAKENTRERADLVISPAPSDPRSAP